LTTSKKDIWQINWRLSQI